MKRERYDVLVVGAGHAGCEAAVAAARMGCRVLLLTGNLDTIGLMSCNPAIGGIGKGQLVRELDALGGVMAEVTDSAAIHYRQLNTSKGRAVRSSRVQVDRQAYRMAMKALLEKEKNLVLAQGMAARVLTRGKTAVGVETELGQKLHAKTVVLAPGTFLNGVVHIGMTQYPAGRMGEAPAAALSRSLADMGFETGRFKTGTPARVDIRSLELGKMKEQAGDDEPLAMSFWTQGKVQNRMMCHVTYTNPKTHRIVQRGLKQSALYGGAIKGTGVRYCPSIEDKVVKFAERERHMVFIEPEGPDTVEAYPNGVSTSLPVDLQLRMLRSIQGMEHCLMLRPGYAIEHDFVQPTELFRTLETRSCRNLFFAGQINGTTGYEEAGAQGLVAGVNAALRVKGKQGFELTRADAYVGVMIDDLVSKGTDEPYRMFTSRVEYRLLLREDNADLRLGAPGRRLGLLPAAKYRAVQDKQKQFNAAIQWLNRERVKPTRAVNARLRRLGTVGLKQSVPAIDLLRRPEVEWVDLCTMTESAPELGVWARQLVEVEVKYAGYIERAQKQLARFHELESIRVPAGIDFRRVAGLSTEIREKLAKAKPKTLAQAESISGVTPAAVFALLVHLKAKK